MLWGKAIMRCVDNEVNSGRHTGVRR